MNKNKNVKMFTTNMKSCWAFSKGNVLVMEQIGDIMKLSKFLEDGNIVMMVGPDSQVDYIQNHLGSRTWSTWIGISDCI